MDRGNETACEKVVRSVTVDVYHGRTVTRSVVRTSSSTSSSLTLLTSDGLSQTVSGTGSDASPTIGMDVRYWDPGVLVIVTIGATL